MKIGKTFSQNESCRERNITMGIGNITPTVMGLKNKTKQSWVEMAGLSHKDSLEF